MNDTPSFSHRRLQREPDFTGGRLISFKHVFLRHGLPGLALAVLLVFVPFLQDEFLRGIEMLVADPLRYTSWAAVIFIAMTLYSIRLNRGWHLPQLGWAIYLGVLSFWEEWIFRVAIPLVLEGFGAAYWPAAFVAALLFGALHYFTLRWKWQWCVGAFVGGLALSRQFALHDDLLLIAAFHWVATFVNTPRLPGQSANQSASQPAS